MTVAAKRTCRRCKKPIEVGRTKVGRVVFPGGVCYDCARKHRRLKLK